MTKKRKFGKITEEHYIIASELHESLRSLLEAKFGKNQVESLDAYIVISITFASVMNYMINSNDKSVVDTNDIIDWLRREIKTVFLTATGEDL